MTKYTVLREYWADRFYEAGETFWADPKDVAHLVGSRIEVFKKKTKKGVSE